MFCRSNQLHQSSPTLAETGTVPLPDPKSPLLPCHVYEAHTIASAAALPSLLGLGPRNCDSATISCLPLARAFGRSNTVILPSNKDRTSIMRANAVSIRANLSSTPPATDDGAASN
ncbi:hypothetical protein MTO96_034943 [Rhipicephalus appendiculatus]